MKDIFSKPNQITFFRVLLIPLLIYFLISDFNYKEYLSAFIFIILSLSDALDGYVARKTKKVTELGKLIDPIADKLLISTALIFLIGKGIPIWMAVIILIREWIITGLRLIFVSKGTVISASILGKLKTLTQTIGILLVILKFPFAWHAMLLAVIFTVISGLDYLIKFSSMIKDGMVNIPNTITFLRLLLTPLFVLSILEEQINLAIMILIITALSDKIDGISARVKKQVTEFGRTFDSFTDWTFILVCIIAGIYGKYVSFIYGLLLFMPFISTALLKLYSLKKFKKSFSSVISRLSVGMGYVTILAVLIDFDYKIFFLSAALGMSYLTMIDFAIKARKS